MTLLLGAAELSKLLTVESSLRVLREGFRTSAGIGGAQRVRQQLSSQSVAMVLLPGLLPDIPAYTVKVNAKFPKATPAIRGVVCLHDLHDGSLLSILDSAYITAWRTGLSAALGTHLLDRNPHGTLGVIGAGAQARLTVQGLNALRSLSHIVVHDTDTARARCLARTWERSGLTCRVAENPREVAAATETLVTATWSRMPLLHAPDVRPHTHITSLGADEPGKQELGVDLLRTSQLYVDNLELAQSSGVLGSAGLTAADAAGTLTDVITAGPRSLTQEPFTTVYSPVGMPWQDLAIAWHAYQLAQDHGAGQQFHFEIPAAPIAEETAPG